MKTACFGGVSLPIAEVLQIRVALENAETLKCLNGPQRQRVDGAIERLEVICDDQDGEEVTLPADLVVELLRCISGTQEWFVQMLNDYVDRSVD